MREKTMLDEHVPNMTPYFRLPDRDAGFWSGADGFRCSALYCVLYILLKGTINAD